MHQFHIYGKGYGISYAGGICFSDDPHAVLIDDFDFDAGDKFTYEYNFFKHVLVDIRIEKIYEPTSLVEQKNKMPICISGSGMPGVDKYAKIDVELKMLRLITKPGKRIKTESIRELVEELNAVLFNSFDIYSLSDVSKDLAVQYITQRGGKPYARTNIKLRQSAMTLFYAWAYSSRYCQVDLMVEYKKVEMNKKPFPKIKQKNPGDIVTILTPEEQHAILKTETSDYFTTTRNRCMISIILMGALYTEDLIKLSIDNVNLEKDYIDIINKKTGKRKIQITSRECELACRNWLSVRDTVFHKRKSSLLFFTKSLSPITRRTFYRIVSKGMEDANRFCRKLK